MILYLRIQFQTKRVKEFAAKFYSFIQNNIGGNIGDWLNFVTCEHPLIH